jgi:hypothetical protein
MGGQKVSIFGKSSCSISDACSSNSISSSSISRAAACHPVREYDGSVNGSKLAHVHQQHSRHTSCACLCSTAVQPFPKSLGTSAA